MSDNPSVTLKEMTSDIVSAFVASNNVSAMELPSLIQSVFKSLSGLGEPEVEAVPETSKATNAQIKKSIRPEGLVSFLDGKSYKTLKRHIAKHGMTVVEYKERFGLPKDYPTTSSDYSEKRSSMAKSLGLGRQAKAIESKPAPKARKPRAAKIAAE